MSKSFYNYIVNDLFLSWFNDNKPAKGSRFCMVVENEKHRKGILDALKEKSEPITINGIYEGSDVEEEGYRTYAFKIATDLPKLIIGDDCSANEDYLTTLRNSVGQQGKYENFGILYILSKSILSSLITASMNLEGLGGPLHPKYIVERIKKDFDIKLFKDVEKIYLKKHLESVSELISDGTANMFDFESTMTVLGAESMSGLFNSLEMFEDRSIYGTASISDKEMEERAEKNKTLYSRISAIMNDDEDDKSKELEKFLDEKSSKKIARSKEDSWKRTDIQELLDSVERKASTDNLYLQDVSLTNPTGDVEIVWNYTGKLGKASKNYIVICDQTTSEHQEVILTFNKNVGVVPKPFKSNGHKVIVPILEKPITCQVGLYDNHHDFYILRLPCDSSLFKEIRNCFSLNKKGEILVKVPDEYLTLSFGKGESEVALATPPKWVWSENEKLVIPVESEDEHDTIEFFVDLGKMTQKITLKLNVAKPVPPLGPDAFPLKTIHKGIERDGVSLKKVTDGEIERGVFGYWRPFLEWEQMFVENSCIAVELEYNELTQQCDSIPLHLNVDYKVRETLTAIYQYFEQKETIPSLCPLDDELRKLYKDYCDAVVNAIASIPVGQSMSKHAHNLTRLGTLYNGDKFYLSPFHPIMVAYVLEYDLQSNGEDASYAKKLLTPFYLIPYLTYKSTPMRPYSNNQLEDIRNWLIFEKADSKQQERANDVTTNMVKGKMQEFIKNFEYLFQNKECPIVISAIGLSDDSNLIKGIVEFIKIQYSKGVQRIELHEYVDDIKDETFFEKLNRLDSLDSIERDLKAIGIDKLDLKGEYTSQDIIHQLFTRMSFYKHDINKCNNEIAYCHIAFYQMNTGSEYVTPSTNETRTELAMNGLISIPSTLQKDGVYYIGFGTKGVKNPEGFIHQMSIAYNNIYGNEKNDGSNTYSLSTGVTKKFAFKHSQLLDSIYRNANWVTFLNPEVDINFFYQQDLYVVHYTDQVSINAKYDSITVTKHIGLYENLLRKSYEKYALSQFLFPQFNETMKNYFNCLNGSWMLRLVNQTEGKVREKMSLVATSIVMERFLQRNTGLIWVPISLDEILRVTGEIGLKMDGIFSKKTLGVKGVMSDDLLMIGLDATDTNNPTLYFYPIEVKASNSVSFADKGAKQVCRTWKQFKEHLFTRDDFETKIYRTFFASQFLANAEKLSANNLMNITNYNTVESCRFALLNLKWNIQEILPLKKMGVAAVVSFYGTATRSMTTRLTEGIPICEIHFSERECFEFVADPSNAVLGSLQDDDIIVDNDAQTVLSSSEGITIQQEEPKSLFEQNLEDDENNDEKDNNIKTTTQPQIKSEKTAPIMTSRGKPIQIVVGSVKGGTQKIIFEPNNTQMVSHPNMGIIGTMGTGKTQFARSVIAQFAKESCHNVDGRPMGLLVFDYKGDYKDQDFLDAVDGTSYKFNYPFNPLKLVVNDEVEGMNLPAITADRIADSFAKAYGLGLKQQSNIKQIIIDTYAEAGITRDPSTWQNAVPTMEQVIEKYFETYDANDKAYALFDKLRDYTIFTSDTTKCVSMFEWLDSVRVIDLTLYPDDTKKVIVSLILDLFYAEMRQLGASKQLDGLRELRAIILVDEAHNFLKKDFYSFRNIISEGRMFGVGMILSTQNISDFKTSKEDYSQFVLSWIIHHVNSISKAEISCIFGASDTNSDRYMEYINKAKIFESICKIGQRVCGIRDLPYFELIKEDKRFDAEGQTGQ